ncbi:MAG: phosphoenolpyruvate kinase [Myxococcales bacterium]|nr:phosphoenolpyruvate kinase [Myxococcales bacterium]
MADLDPAAPPLVALAAANRAFARRYPGEREGRQPVHTVYGGAHLFRADTARKLGELALRSLDAYGRDPVEFAIGVGFLPEAALAGVGARELAEAWARDPEALRRARPAAWLAAAVHRRVRAKLEREAVEDLRIDFEDGFGVRPDAEEDETARSAALELARALASGSAPPFVGIRIKSLGEETSARALRTLSLFLDALLTATGGRLPPHFVVTLPKVTVPEQPSALSYALAALERAHGLAAGALRIELMIEVAQALMGEGGRSPLGDFLDACEGRCTGAHLGTYDFTASCNVTAAHQSMDHPLCDLARGLMILAYAGRGIALSDGATNVLPVVPHPGAALTEAQAAENRAAVHRAWRLSHGHIRGSLRSGLYQGWDLHPGQLPVRFAACYAFFLEGFGAAADRLRHFMAQAAQATRVGEVFDDAATGQGLLNYFLRAQNCGAIELDELAATGLTRDEIALRSFPRILDARRRREGTGS